VKHVVRYIGTLASATITVVSATSITLKHGAAGAEAADTTVDGNGVIEFATYTTLGAVVDQINLSPNWRAEIIDGLRADAVNGSQLKALSEYTLSPTKVEVKGLYWDTSASLSLTYAISRRRLNFSKTQKQYQAFFEEARALVNVGSGTLTLNIYDVTRDRGTATLLASFAGTDNTALTANIAGGNEQLISEFGHDLLVRYVTSVDLPDTGAYLNVAGYIA